jgi:hypothetical protein
LFSAGKRSLGLAQRGCQVRALYFGESQSFTHAAWALDAEQWQ